MGSGELRYLIISMLLILSACQSERAYRQDIDLVEQRIYYDVSYDNVLYYFKWHLDDFSRADSTGVSVLSSCTDSLDNLKGWEFDEVGGYYWAHVNPEKYSEPENTTFQIYMIVNGEQSKTDCKLLSEMGD